MIWVQSLIGFVLNAMRHMGGPKDNAYLMVKEASPSVSVTLSRQMPAVGDGQISREVGSLLVACFLRIDSQYAM